MTIPAFPDFDVATLPNLPDGFEDVSFCNDMCPSFQNDDLGLIIYVDDLDVAARECPESPRFSLHFMDWSANGWQMPEVTTDDNCIVADDFDAILAALAAAQGEGLIEGCRRVYRRGVFCAVDSRGGPDWEEPMPAYSVFDDTGGHHGDFTTLEAAKAHVDSHGAV